MATIFNVQGYETMRKCVGTIKKYVEVCAYKALCAAASPNNDPADESWYPAFLEEERKIAQTFDLEIKAAAQEDREVDKNIPRPIPRCEGKPKKDTRVDENGFILNCSDLDMQAFMKVFYYRDDYRKKLMETFAIAQERKIKSASQSLIEYRNKEFAHIPVNASEKELSDLTPEMEQEIIENCNASIKKFFAFLRLFPQLGADKENRSYYDSAYQQWREAKTELKLEEVELETIIQRERLAVGVQALMGICKECGITVVIPEGKPYLITGDYEKTVKPICAMAQILAQKDAQMRSRAQAESELEKTRAVRKRMGLVIVLCTVFIGILVAFLLILLGRDGGAVVGEAWETETRQAVVETTLAAEIETAPTEAQTIPTETTPVYTGPAFISGTGAYAGLTFQVNQMKAAGILISYTNDGLSDYSLGWVGGAQVDVQTTVGTFTVYTDNQKIYKNTSGAFSVNLGQELMGQIQAIVVRGIRPLSGSGLPTGSECTIRISITEGDPTAPNAATAKVIRGQGSYEGLLLTIDQKLSGGISVQYENSDANAFSLGWVETAKVTVKTTEGNVGGQVTKNGVKIGKGTTGTFVIEISDEIPGTVQEIVIHNVNALNAMGLPDHTKRNQNVTIPITQSEE